MSRKRIIWSALLGVLVIGVVIYHLLPKRYEVMERRQSTLVLWKHDDILIFVEHYRLGRTQNALQRKLEKKIRDDYALLMLLTESVEPLGDDHNAFLIHKGTITNISLPSDFRTDKWRILANKLVSASYEGAAWKWEGTRFIPLTSSELRALSTHELLEKAGPKIVKSDDEETEDDFRNAPFAQLKTAGWHYKQIWMRDRTIILPITTQSGVLNLTQEAVAASSTSTDPLGGFGRCGDLTIQGGPFKGTTLIARGSDGKWKEVRKSDYQQTGSMVFRHQRRIAPMFSLVFWAILLFVTFLRYSFVLDLFRIFGLKRRLIRNIATSYSVPPAVPEQFPAIDRSALDKYSSDLQSLGFVQLGDFSLVPNGKVTTIPAFVRLFRHTREKCYAEILQVFPPRGRMRKAYCAFVSTMEDGWKIVVSDNQPEPGSVFVRQPRALSRCFPNLAVSDLLKKFSEFRNQVSIDLQIKPLANETIEQFISDVQNNAAQMQAALKTRNVWVALAHYHKRRLTRNRVKPMYEWLGDYPKVAEQRKSAWASTTTIGATQ